MAKKYNVRDTQEMMQVVATTAEMVENVHSDITTVFDRLREAEKDLALQVQRCDTVQKRKAENGELKRVLWSPWYTAAVVLILNAVAAVFGYIIAEIVN